MTATVVLPHNYSCDRLSIAFADAPRYQHIGTEAAKRLGFSSTPSFFNRAVCRNDCLFLSYKPTYLLFWFVGDSTKKLSC